MTNQILKNLIENDIFCNASPLIGDLLSNSDAASALNGCDYDDLLSLTSAPDCSEPPEGYRVFEGDSTGWWWELEGSDGDGTPQVSGDDYDTEAEAIQAAYEDNREDPPESEVFEHWIVSDSLARELESIGAPVAHDVFGWCIWGRTETGQSLSMDSALKAVAEQIHNRIDTAA